MYAIKQVFACDTNHKDVGNCKLQQVKQAFSLCFTGKLRRKKPKLHMVRTCI